MSGIQAAHRAPPPGLDYVWTTPPDPATVCEVATGVLWIRMPLPFALDHINLWLLEDTDGWTIVDTGICRDEVKELWRSLFSGVMATRRVRRLIATHFHPDHLGLAGWLHEEVEAPLWMTRTEWLMGTMLYHDVDGRIAARQVDFYRSHGLDQRWLDALSAGGNRYRLHISPPPPSFHRLSDGDVMKVGGRDWRVIVGMGHAPEHACLYCAELSLLIAGDQILPRITPNVALSAAEPDANPLGLFLDSLTRIRRLPSDTLVLPSHGYPFRGLHERIDQMSRHHHQRLDALLVACEEPRSAADLLSVLFKRELDAHQIMFAMGESLSHLAYLAKDHKLETLRGSDEITRYQRVEDASG